MLLRSLIRSVAFPGVSNARDSAFRCRRGRSVSTTHWAEVVGHDLGHAPSRTAYMQDRHTRECIFCTSEAVTAQWPDSLAGICLKSFFQFFRRHRRQVRIYEQFKHIILHNLPIHTYDDHG